MDDGWEAEIGARLRGAREKAGLTRPRVADLVTAHVNTVIAWEKGEGDFWGQLPALAKIYDTDLRWLIHGKTYVDPLEDLARRMAGVESQLGKVVSRLDVYVDATERSALEAETEARAAQSERSDAESAKGKPGRRRKAQ